MLPIFASWLAKGLSDPHFEVFLFLSVLHESIVVAIPAQLAGFLGLIPVMPSALISFFLILPGALLWDHANLRPDPHWLHCSKSR